MNRIIAWIALVVSLFAVAIGVVNIKKLGAVDVDSIVYEQPVNTLTPQEIEEGWILMFDGETLNGWRGYNRTTLPDSGWIVENGTIRCEGSGGDIIYDRKFTNFEFKIEWKISEGGNSGIFYLVQEIEGVPIYMSAPEMQVLDNYRHPDANAGVNGNRKACALYDLIPPVPLSEKPAGEWNTVRLVINNGHVTHYFNGNKVVEYQLDSPEFAELVAKSKFSKAEHFAKATEGFIGVQDHGNAVWFRNIKIKEL